MYTLRIIEETRNNETVPFEQVIENYELGSSYSVLRRGITSEFDNEMKNRYPDLKLDGIKALICGQNGDSFVIEEPTPIRQHDYFIMTESGKTFERLT